jgi:hypothetical protein
MGITALSSLRFGAASSSTALLHHLALPCITHAVDCKVSRLQPYC